MTRWLGLLVLLATLAAWVVALALLVEWTRP